MRKLLSIALCFAGLQASAQLTLEHTYQGNTFQIVKLEGEQEKYVVIEGNKIVLYNDNHSIWRSFPVTIPNGDIVSVSCISKNFLDTDNDIEMFVTYYDQSATPAYTSILVDEAQGITITWPSVYYVSPHKINNKWRLSASNSTTSETKVYSTPGQYTGVVKVKKEDADAELYPNPMGNAATLKYNLPAGVNNGTIQVMDMAGHVLRTYQVSNQFSDILINRGELPAGVYTYQLSAQGANPVTERFIIQ